MNEINNLQLLIDRSLFEKDKWSQEQIEKREDLRKQIEVIRG